MALTRDYKQTVIERAQRDPAFGKALLDEAATLFLNGEPDTARLILRDLVNATVGFEGLAAATSKPSKSLHTCCLSTATQAWITWPRFLEQCVRAWVSKFKSKRPGWPDKCTEQ